MKGKSPVSVVIIAKNEEANIKDCIASVIDWADEVILVDDESIDRTVEIAREMGARVLKRKMDIEGRHRNWAYTQAKNEWVLSLDADERVSEGLKEEIMRILDEGTDYSAFSIPLRNYIGDYWIRYGGWYPAGKIRLFRKDIFKYEEVEVHPRVFLDGKCGHLKKDLIHYSYRDWGDFLKKLNNQTKLEAKKWYNLSFENPKKAQYKMNFIHTLWRALDRFIRTFFIKKGYRDGFVGFMVAYFASLYQIVSYAKYKEFKKEKVPIYNP
ncbi:MAG: glycosyltransferase family 2 protein [Candidatus Omnitrophica bacterium]|nr:glycosyltransferase family 2 protein [Candidatus Omnitrophota bacterium]